MKLGLFVLPSGQHIAGWRLPEAQADMHVDFASYRTLARRAEEARFDMLFVADNDGVQAGAWSREALSRTANRFAAQFEPLTLLSAIAACTTHLGVVGTASTTYFDPYRLARQFASLDLLSGGRAAWNIVTSHDASAAANFGIAPLEHAARYERAEEFVGLVEKLWRSWEPDAFPRDKAGGVFFDPARLHAQHHEGRHFRVSGPLNVAPSAQGHPVLVQAGSSGPGRDLAARKAEVVFTAQTNLRDAQAFYADIRRRAADFGRAPDALKIMPGVSCIAAATEAEARDRFEAMQSLIDPAVGLAHLQTLLGVSLEGHALDEPVRELPASNAMQSRHALFLGMAREEGLTLRQLYQRAAGAKGHLLLVGTGAQIAGTLARWFEEGAADGFNVMPPYLPGGFDDFVTHVLPELRSRGLVREAYAGTTLRENLAQ
ncbi:LLM class flavin-dependent oxidoreductase [Rhodovarius crocodyli]|nr:LLM class flavin-dependent oxidoreductase [Rhodovarius crocodyli]